MTESAGFSSLAGQRYINLETYRRNGLGVRTPVWFTTAPGAANPVLYVGTFQSSGKIKRIRRSAEAKIAVCDRQGAAKGPWIDARARIVTGGEQDYAARLLNRKYWPWRQLLNFPLFRRSQPVVIAIEPA
jgi:hypothetical protein